MLHVAKSSGRTSKERRLYALQHRLLELPLNLLPALIGSRLAVQAKKGAEIEFGLLEKLDFADMNLCHIRNIHFPLEFHITYVLKGVNAVGGLLNLTSDNFGDELGSELRKSAAGSFPLDDLSHLLPDGTDLRALSICGLLDLVRASLGEGNSEDAEKVVVGGLDGDIGLDEGLPLAHQRAELVGSEVQSVEIGEAVLALNLIDTELDLAERMLLIFLEIGQGNLNNSALERVIGVLQTGGAVDESLADTV